MKNEELLNIINEFKISNDFNNKEKSAEEEILKRDIILESRLPTFKTKNLQFKLYKIKNEFCNNGKLLLFLIVQKIIINIEK